MLTVNAHAKAVLAIPGQHQYNADCTAIPSWPYCYTECSIQFDKAQLQQSEHS